MQRIESISAFSSARVLVEFDTGGNVRLEEGKPVDPWYRNCVELIGSRFLAKVFFGILWPLHEMLLGILEYRHNWNQGGLFISSILSLNDCLGQSGNSCS